MEIQDVILPGWVTALLLPALAGIIYWLIFVTRITLDNREKIAVNTADDVNNREFMKGLKQMVSEIKSEMMTRTDKIEGKVDELFKIIAYKR
jgi:hypothetical protein